MSEGNISRDSSESEEFFIVDDISIKEEPIEPIDLSSDSEEEMVLSHEDEMALQEAADAAIASWLSTLSDEDDVGDPARNLEECREDIEYIGEVKRKAVKDGDHDQEEEADRQDERDVGDPARKRLREADHDDIEYIGEVKRKAVKDGDHDQEEEADRQDERERDRVGCPDCRIM